MYADQSVKLTDQKEPRIVNTGIGVRKIIPFVANSIHLV